MNFFLLCLQQKKIMQVVIKDILCTFLPPNHFFFGWVGWGKICKYYIKRSRDGCIESIVQKVMYFQNASHPSGQPHQKLKWKSSLYSEMKSWWKLMGNFISLKDSPVFFSPNAPKSHAVLNRCITEIFILKFKISFTLKWSFHKIGSLQNFTYTITCCMSSLHSFSCWFEIVWIFTFKNAMRMKDICLILGF